MQKSCAQCSAAFEITEDDLAFYDKVSPVFNGKKESIPPPSLCADCRCQRRLAFRNERHLYHRKCDASGKQIISIFPSGSPYKVYEQQEWWSDAWDPQTYGREFDFTRTFFGQFAELMLAVPRRNLVYFQNENSDFTNVCSHNKNCYLLFSSDYCQDCYFVSNLQQCVSCLDTSVGAENQRSYGCLNVQKCYECIRSVDCRVCNACLWCVDCAGCTDCAFSSNLRNKKFCFQNEQLTEDAYRERMAIFRTGSRKTFAEADVLFERVLRESVRQGIHGQQNENSSGDYLTNTRECRSCFNMLDSEHCAHVWDGVSCKDSSDCNEVGFCELTHETIEVFPKGYNVHWCCFGAENADLLYSDHCYNSKNLFGCVGLKKAEYCILNKQYSKEEYEELVPRIIEHMRGNGEWGEFFPITLSPFGYTDTVAQEYFPCTAADAARSGWKWQDDEAEQEKYLGPATSVQDSIHEVPDDIIKHILRCEVTGKPYKIIPQELQFYRDMNIPIPRVCPAERHRERMALRNPRKLWSRSCAKCSKPIETSYAPDRPEIVYCEACYLVTVY